MKRLIKRYVLKAQVDRESDEVNEGKNSLFISARSHYIMIYIHSCVCMGVCTVCAGQEVCGAVCVCMCVTVCVR